MSEYCVMIADAAKARFFTLETAEIPEMQSSPMLVERHSMSNAEATMPGREKYSEVKSGRNIGASGAHGYDDHRANHDDESDRRFAQKIASQFLKLAEQNNARQLVIAAEKQMLGVLRHAISVPSGSGFEVMELAKDLTKFSPTEIHSHLAGDTLLPEQKRPKN